MLPPRIRMFVGLCAALAVGIAVASLRLDATLSVEALLGFGLLVLLAEQFPISLSLGSSYSVSFVITIAATVAAGPAEAALATAWGFTTLRDVHRRPPIRHVFNVAQLVITAGTGGIVYQLAGGPVGRTSTLFPRVLLPLIVCTAANFLMNTLLVSTVVSLTEGKPIAAVWREQYASLRGGYVAFALLGVLLAVLYLEMGWGSALFLLVPLLVARNAFQAAVKMQGAFDATARSLITAIEVKDTYTRGHAERVSRLSEMIAREFGLRDRAVRQIRYAALMHDVGKLVVSTRVLQKPGKLTDDEYEHMKTHPIRGHEIVSEIDLLADVVDAVRSHHERIDGKGYPDGLQGEEIPLLAKLITVADAFDSMTSTRSYRPMKTFEDAFAELRRCAGTQFDPGAIDALERAVHSRGWTAAPEHREEDDVRAIPG